MHNLSCENEFYLHENEKWFPYQRLSTYPRFETEARGNSEMTYLESSAKIANLRSICYRLHHKYVNTDSSLQEAIASYRLRYRPLRRCFCSRLVKPLFFGLKHIGFKAAPNSSCIKWRYSSRPSFYKHDPKWRLKMHYCTLWRSLWRLRELSTIDIIILFNI